MGLINFNTFEGRKHGVKIIRAWREGIRLEQWFSNCGSQVGRWGMTGGARGAVRRTSHNPCATSEVERSDGRAKFTLQICAKYSRKVDFFNIECCLVLIKTLPAKSTSLCSSFCHNTICQILGVFAQLYLYCSNKVMHFLVLFFWCRNLVEENCIHF